MATSRSLSDAFYSGSLLGQPTNPIRTLQGQAAAQANALNPQGLDSRGQKSQMPLGGFGANQVFNTQAYEAAVQQGYGPSDINSFLRESGVQAEGDWAEEAGTDTYGGKVLSYWQINKNYQPPSASSAKRAATKIVTSAPVPVLGDPLGPNSQRARRRSPGSTRLTIAP
jgi:hypothetical protein